VVDEDDRPVPGARVLILIDHIHGDTSQSNMTDHTSNDGIAHFEFANGTSAHIYVNGILELLNVGSDDQITVSI
jgi:hypothetical protein